jgi:hypothetical protein
MTLCIICVPPFHPAKAGAPVGRPLFRSGIGRAEARPSLINVGRRSAPPPASDYHL